MIYMNKTDTNEYYAQKSKEWRSRNPDKVKLSNIKTKSKIPSCHPERKHKAKGLCQHCYRRHQIATNPIVRQKYKDREKKRSQKRSKDPQYKLKSRNRMLKRQYNIDIIQYNELFSLQNGKCAICVQGRFTNKNKHFHVDHDHQTGKIRGLLCYKCNWYMADIDKNPEIVYNLIKYKGITQ